MGKFFRQYAGLRKEMYIIFWGRVVTNMGALIWPMLTLILTNKLGYSAGEAANMMILVGIIQLPCTLIGGKLADRFNKKNIIVVCDLITVACYLLCSALPISRFFIVLFCVAGIFAQFEWPSYDALVANLSAPEDRERAYSLNYLGGNLGLVLAPTLGGFLFENHLPLAFLISGLATLSSTILIFFFVHDISQEKGNSVGNEYEQGKQDASTHQIFAQAPILLLFVLAMGVIHMLYTVGFSFLMPLNMEQIFGSKGAILFGTLTSVNALVVIIGTPLCTGLLTKLRDVQKLQGGMFLQSMGYVCFLLANGRIPLYYLSIVIFTLGEILVTLGQQPYLTRRIPDSHRGRISSVNTVVSMIFQGMCLSTAGYVADRSSLGVIWMGMIGIGIVNLALLFLLQKGDRKQFPLLYGKKEEI